MNLTRRTALAWTGGVLATGSLAGCLDDVDREGNTTFDSGYAAFFTLRDWTEQVSDGVATFETPVEIGNIGHGWEPDTDLVRDIAGTDAFVYLDTPEFSWAQDVAETLEADYDHVTVIDALDGLEDQLLSWDHSHDHDHDGDHDHDEDRGDDDGHDDHDDHDDHGHDGDHGHNDAPDHDDDDRDDRDGEDHSDHNHDDNDHSHNDDPDRDGEDRGDYDPHVWVDPVLAKDVVDTIADGLTAVDPDSAETFEANADAYKARLDSLDEQFQEVVENADHDVGVIAGHDSFQYLEERYGFELHSPQGVSPAEQPSFADIAETIELVNERGIDTILYDTFESPNLAEQIVEGSDATETVPLTPAEGTTDAWTEKGWGYVEQMEEINVPAFERALGSS